MENETNASVETTPCVLVGHTNQETAYVVSDYPYGGLRCQIRFWIEQNPKKGFRFVSQTQNPKTGVWNNPKKGTYSLFAMAMFIDPATGHVEHAAVNEHTDANKVLEFAKRFPQACTRLLLAWCMRKSAFNKVGMEGKIVFSMNGVERPVSESDIARYKAEHDAWQECIGAISHVVGVKLEGGTNMTVAELIELLKNCDPNAQVLLATQPNYPFENSLIGVAVRKDIEEEIDDATSGYGVGCKGNDVFLVDGGQVRYASKDIWNNYQS